jgi:hypothetical protein
LWTLKRAHRKRLQMLPTTHETEAFTGSHDLQLVDMSYNIASPNNNMDGQCETRRSTLDGQCETRRSTLDGQREMRRSIMDGQCETRGSTLDGQCETRRSIMDGQRETRQSTHRRKPASGRCVLTCSVHEESAKRYKVGYKKSFITVLLYIITFAVFTCPFFYAMSVRIACPSCWYRASDRRCVRVVLVVLLYTKSIVNPLLYSFRFVAFREALLKYCGRQW